MKYKGFIIEPVPLLDYKPDPKSRSGEWKAVRIGTQYYNVLDPMEGDRRQMACDTITECKSEIDRLLKIMGMKDNTKASWDKLDREAKRYVEPI